MIDIKNKKCKCGTSATYGFPQNSPTCCVSCKKAGMISKPNSKCRIRSCGEKARYGTKTPIHCELHKRGNDIDLVERNCVKCGKLDVVNQAGICVNFCLISDEGMKIYQKNQKTKQDRVLKVLTTKIGKPSLVDKIVDRDCGKERPDIVYDEKTFNIIVETDENQHKHGYCPEGERNRMRNIYMACEGKPVVFIRYNPDNYYVNGKLQKTSLKKREETLIRWINHFQKMDSLKCALSVLYLFYDNYDETKQKIEEIKPY